MDTITLYVFALHALLKERMKAVILTLVSFILCAVFKGDESPGRYTHSTS
jgi:hypothetical protein